MISNNILEPWRKSVELVLRIVIVLSVLGGFCCGLSAFKSTFVSGEEYSDYYQSLMERDPYLKLQQIGHEYGVFTEHYYYWKYIEHSQEEADRAYKTISSMDNGTKNMFSKAISNNFIVPVDPERDKRIIQDYERLQIKRNYRERKMDPYNRYKDVMDWRGGICSLFLITFVSYKALMYMRRIPGT